MKTILLVVTSVALVGFALASSTRAASSAAERLALRFEPGATYSRTETVTHHVTYEMSKALRGLAGSRAAPVTILEVRNRSLHMFNGSGQVKIDETNSRRYVDSKNKSVVTRHADYSGTLSSDGKRSPAPGSLGDPGDGALDQLPDQPLTVGQTWTFSRNFLVDRSLGQGVMTYTDKVVRIETRGRKSFAIISVNGAGRADLASDLQKKGFHTADLILTGTGEFDITDGLPGVQHYTAHAKWSTRVMFARIGVDFDDTYDAAPWMRSPGTSAGTR